jgi:hypothetical protein
MANDRSDLGKKVDTNGAGLGAAQLTTSYTPGDVFNAGGTLELVLWVEVDAASGTNLTSVQFKLQASYDGTRWVDVATIALDATNTTTAVVAQSVTAVAGDTVVAAYRTQAHRLLNFHRLVGKATAGGALVAGDAVRAFAKAA